MNRVHFKLSHPSLRAERSKPVFASAGLLRAIALAMTGAIKNRQFEMHPINTLNG
jgi:hypothetical protein